MDFSRKIQRENCPSTGSKGEKEIKEQNSAYYFKGQKNLLQTVQNKLTIFLYMQKLKLAINNVKIA